MMKWLKFFSINPQALAWFRISLALGVIIDLSSKLVDYQAFFTDEGVLTRAQQINNSNLWSVLFISGSAEWSYLIIFLALIAATGLLMGLKPKLMSLILWILVVSLQNRNGLILNGGDDLLRILLFWMIFLPDRQRLSLGDEKDSWPNENILSIATIALFFQIIMIYWQTSILKTGSEWQDGTALELVLHLDFLTTDFGKFLSNYPELLKKLTFTSLILETYGFLLLFVPHKLIRKLVVIGFGLFHLGIALTMHIGIFPWLCLTFWTLFWPSKNHKLLNWGSSKAETLLGGFLIVSTCWWVGAGAGKLSPVAPSIQKVFYTLRLDQHWGMFAPSPLRTDGYFVFRGIKDNGEEVPLVNNFSINQMPLNLSTEVKNEAWRKYFSNLAMPVNYYHWENLAQYLCRQSKDFKLSSIKIIRVEELSMLNKKYENLVVKKEENFGCN